MAKYFRRISVVVECRMNQREGGGNKSRYGLKLCTAWVVRNGGLSCLSEGIGAVYKDYSFNLGSFYIKPLVIKCILSRSDKWSAKIKGTLFLPFL